MFVHENLLACPKHRGPKHCIGNNCYLPVHCYLPMFLGLFEPFRRDLTRSTGSLHFQVPITPKIVFHLKNLCVFVSKMVKELLFLLENSIFYAPSKSQKITDKNSHDRACEGPGSIPGLTSQTVLHACL